MDKLNKKKWYEILEDRYNTLMAKFDMPEDISHEIYNFVFQISKEQYMRGNSSGIAWLRKQMRGEGKPTAEPVAA
jgi:hypothetical protein